MIPATASSRAALPGSRQRLLLSTALVAAAATASPMASDTARAQSLPDPALATIAAKSTGGLDPQFGLSPNGKTLGVDLNAQATVINWPTFDVPTGTKVNFTTALTGDVSVLNRVVGDGVLAIPASRLDGDIRADPNVFVWLANPSGIIFGAKGTFAGGGLALTTADVGLTDFTDGNTTYALSGAAAGKSITLTGGDAAGRIFAPLGLLVVGQNITNDGLAIRAATNANAAPTGEVALVAARDVSVDLTPGGLLGVTITAGTAVGSALVSNGAIDGKSVKIVGAGDTAALLLNVSGDITATATDGRIIIGTRTSAFAPTEFALGTGVTGNSGDSTLLGTAPNLSGKTVEFNGATDASAAGLDLALAQDAVFNGIVGATTPLNSLAVGGNTTFAAGSSGALSLTTTADQAFGGSVTLDANTMLLSGGTILFNGQVLATTDDTFSLDTQTATGTDFLADVGTATAQLASLTVTGVTDLNGANVYAGNQLFNDAVKLTTDVTLTSANAGNITFRKTVDSDAAATPRALTVNTAGQTVFEGNVGANFALFSLQTDAPGGTVLGKAAAAAMAVITTQTQEYKDAVTLAADTTLTSNGVYDITFRKTVDSDAAAPRALTVNTAGQSVFEGNVGSNFALYSLETDAPGGTVLGKAGVAGHAVTTTHTQEYKDAVTLAADTTLASNGVYDVTFRKTIDSDAVATPRALTVNTAGQTVFEGDVGSNFALFSLTTDAAGSTVLGKAAAPAIAVTTAQAQEYRDAVTLKADTTLTSNGVYDITFRKTVDSDAAAPRALAVNTAGQTVFEGDVGNTFALKSLDTDAPGATVLGQAVALSIVVTTVQTQRYRDPVTLKAATKLTVTDPASLAQFDATVRSFTDGTYELTVLGNATFVGKVGDNAQRLAKLTVTAPTLVRAVDDVLAVGDIVLDSSVDAQLKSITSTDGTVTVYAKRDVTGAVPALATAAQSGDLSVGTLFADTGDALVSAAFGDVRIGNATATGKLDVRADAGSVTGLGAAQPADGAVLLGKGNVVVQADRNVVLSSATSTAGNVLIVGDVNPRPLSVVAGSLNGFTGVAAEAVDGMALGTVTGSTVTLFTAGGTARDESLNYTSPSGVEKLTANYGFANLKAINGAVTVYGQQVAQLGVVDARTDVLVGTGAFMTPQFAAVTVQEAWARTGLIDLRAQLGALYLGRGDAALTANMLKLGTAGELRVTGKAATAATSVLAFDGLQAQGGIEIDTTSDARLKRVNSVNGAVTVMAARDVTGLRPPEPAFAPPGELSVGSLASGFDGFVSAASGDVRIGSATVLRDLDVSADQGSVTGLGAAPGGIGAELTARAPVLVQADGNVVLTSAVSTTDAVTVVGFANPRPLTVAAGLVDGAIGVSVEAVQAISLGTARSLLGSVFLQTTGGTAVDEGSHYTSASGNETLTANYGFANLNATNGAVRVDGLQVAQLGVVEAGTDVLVGTGVLSPSRFAAVTVQEALAHTRLIDLRAQIGALYLGRGDAATTASLLKLGPLGELRVTGNAATAGTSVVAYDGLQAGGDATIDTATDARLKKVQSVNASVTVRANRDVTGLRPPEPGIAPSGELSVGTLTSARDALVNAATGDVRIGNAVAATSLDVTATSGSVTGLGTAPGGTGAILLARTDVAVRADGDVVLTSASAIDGNVLIRERANASLSARSVAAGTLSAGTGVSVYADRAVSLGTVTSSNGTVFLQTTGGTAVNESGNYSSAAGVETLDANFGSANLKATSGAVRVDGRQLAQLGVVDAGTDVKVGTGAASLAKFAAVTVQEALARTGLVDLQAQVGALYLGRGNAATTIGLQKLGVSGELRVTGNAAPSGASAVTFTGLTTSTGDISVSSATQALVLADVTAGSAATTPVVSGNYTVTGATGVTLGDTRARTQQAYGAATITATTGDVTQGSGLLTLQSDSGARGTRATQTYDLRVRALDAAGNVALGNSVLSGGPVTGPTSDVLVNAGADLTLDRVYGRSVTVLADNGKASVLGDVTAGGGNYAVTGKTGVLLGDGVARTQKATGTVNLKATAGDIAQGPGRLTLQSDSAGGGTRAVSNSLALAASGNVALGNSHLVGGSSLVVGATGTSDVFVDAGQSMTLADVDGRSVGLRAQAGALAATTLAASEDIAGKAGTTLTVGSATAADDLALTSVDNLRLTTGAASGTGATASRVDLSAFPAVVSGEATTLSGPTAASVASGGTAVLRSTRGDVTVQTSLTARHSGADAITIDAWKNADLSGLQSTAGDIRVTSDNIAVRGPVTADAANANGFIRLINRSDTPITATNTTTTIGGDVAATDTGTDAGGYTVNQAELDRLKADNVVFVADQAGGRQDVALARFNIGANTGRMLFGALATGLSQIDIVGDITETASTLDRRVQIGGSEGTDVASVAAKAAQINGHLETGTVTLPKSILDLRAAQILFGTTAVFADVAKLGDPKSAATIDAINTQIVANAGSKLYSEVSTTKTYLTAQTLRVRYSNFALFQNTGGAFTASGVVLGPQTATIASPQPAGPIALLLDGGGPTATNAFAIFGQINGFMGRPAGLLTEDVIRYSVPGSLPRIINITQPNSRVNGCVVGSPDKGCLITDVPPPTINMFDERQVQVFDPGTGDTRVLLDPVVGANNEALIGDIAAPRLNYDLPLCEPGQTGCEEGKRK